MASQVRLLDFEDAKIQQYVFTIELAFVAGGAVAQDATPSVEVQGVKNPDMKS